MHTRGRVLIAVLAGTALAGCSGTAGSALAPTVNARPMDANDVRKLDGTIPAFNAVPDAGKALLVGAGARLQLDATASPQVVTIEHGDFQAAPGQHLLAVKFHLRGEFRKDRPTKTHANSVALILDGTRTVLDPDELTIGENLLGLSIPNSAKDVAFELATGELRQQVSLTTGARIADGPAVLYRADAKANRDEVTQVTASVAERLSFPFALYESNKTTPWLSDTYPTIVDVQQADLDYAIEQPNGELLYPSSKDKAFLTLHTEVSGGNSWMTVLETKNFVVTTADGKEITAGRFDDPELRRGELRSNSNQFLGGLLYWEVPGDLKSATVRITAGKSKQINGNHMLDYHDAEKSFPVQF